MTPPLRWASGRRLWPGLMALSLVCTVGMAVLEMGKSRDEVHALLDLHLAQTAQALVPLSHSEGSNQAIALRREASEMPLVWGPGTGGPQDTAALSQGDALWLEHAVQPLPAPHAGRLRYQVWFRDGRLLVRSAQAPLVAMTLRDGFSDATQENGQTWRHFAMWDRLGDFRVVVAEEGDLRRRMVNHMAWHVAGAFGWVLPVCLLWIWFAMRRSLEPLGPLSRHLAGRTPADLQPLPVADVPPGLRPLVDSLNGLLRRMAQGLEAERRFTAHAAHELRTPLAVLQVQVHLLQVAPNAAERQHALAQLQRGVERAIRLVGHLLTLARLEPQQSLPEAQPLHLGAIAQSVCADLAPLALQRRQTLELHACPDWPQWAGHADMFSMLLSNLLDNAIRYTPDGGHIRVGPGRVDGVVCLQVQDDGPGIPVDLRERVLEPFYRLAASGPSGNGLGLAISQRIAQLHGLTLRLDAGAQGVGTCASVYPAAPSPDAGQPGPPHSA